MVDGGETDQRLDKAADLLKELIVVNKEVVTEIRATREEVKAAGEILADKIDDAREEIVVEVRELRIDLRDDLKERLVKMEADVSQIKAKIGL